jgi:transcriptional regulator NrdR family protein
MVFNAKSVTTKVREQLFNSSIAMADTVIKKDGTEQPFSEQKVRDSVLAALRDAGVPDEEGEDIVEYVTKSVAEFSKEQDEITTAEIRDKILEELDEKKPEAADAWRRYETMQQDDDEEKKDEGEDGDEGEEKESGDDSEETAE